MGWSDWKLQGVCGLYQTNENIEGVHDSMILTDKDVSALSIKIFEQ